MEILKSSLFFPCDMGKTRLFKSCQQPKFQQRKVKSSKPLHSCNLRWQWKIHHLKMYFLFKMVDIPATATCMLVYQRYFWPLGVVKSSNLPDGVSSKSLHISKSSTLVLVGYLLWTKIVGSWQKLTVELMMTFFWGGMPKYTLGTKWVNIHYTVYSDW